MLVSDILSECARRIGDTNASFISTNLLPTFNFVISELAQEGCLSLIRKQNSFALNVAGVTSANGLTLISTAAATVLNLVSGRLPDRINRLLVPEWGISEGFLAKVEDQEFEKKWVESGTDFTGRPQWWRIYPTLAQVQLWPACDTDSLTATVFMEWESAPTALVAADTITEILLNDMPTLLAGLFRHGIRYQDETLNDAPLAEANWVRGVTNMKTRLSKAQYDNRDVRIKYRDV